MGVTLKIKSNFARDVFDVQLPGQLRKGSGQNKDEYVVVRETSDGEKDPDKAKKYNDANFVHEKVAEALIGTDLDKERKLSGKAKKQDWWEKSISQGVFSVLFRVSSFPTIIAEWLVQEPTKERYLDYLRLLRFQHMDLNPSFLHLCLADYYYVTRNTWRARNIKILCQKFNPGETATRNSGVELMAELQGQNAYVGVVPESPDSNF